MSVVTKIREELEGVHKAFEKQAHGCGEDYLTQKAILDTQRALLRLLQMFEREEHLDEAVQRTRDSGNNEGLYDGIDKRH